MKTAGHKKGFFRPRNQEKYIGDINKIVYRSSWEQDFMRFLDNNIKVIRWASEEIAIPYVKPTTGRVHKYYPDFYVEYLKAGKLVKEVVEVKPDKQIRRPTTKGKKKQTQLYEAVTWAINMAKWKAAQQYCAHQGFRFKLMSEKHIFR